MTLWVIHRSCLELKTQSISFIVCAISTWFKNVIPLTYAYKLPCAHYVIKTHIHRHILIMRNTWYAAASDCTPSKQQVVIWLSFTKNTLYFTQSKTLKFIFCDHIIILDLSACLPFKSNKPLIQCCVRFAYLSNLPSLRALCSFMP